MSTLYALNLNFDPAETTGRFQAFNSTNNTGKAWFKSTDGGNTWTFAGNPDSFAPVLSLSQGDQVQFAVSAAAGSSPSVQSAVIYVSFARDRKAAGNPNPAKIASPFLLTPGGSPRCLLTGPSNTSPAPWFWIGPYTLGINTANSGNGQLRFEFSIVARVTFSDSTTKDYGYDPEMDVDV